MQTRAIKTLTLIIAALWLTCSITVAGSFTSDFSNPAQTGFTLNGGMLADGVTPYPAIVNGYLLLTTNQGSLQGAIVLDDLDGGAAIESFTASFKLQIGPGSGNAADGTAFCFGDSITSASNFGEEGTGNGVIIAFDIYDNGSSEAPAIDVKYGGATIAHTLFAKADLVTSQFENVAIQVTRSGTLNLTWRGQPVYQNLVLPGYAPTVGQFAIGARTGGENANQRIDNLQITTQLVGPDIAPTITAQPQNATVAEHGNATFTVGFDGTAPLAFLWYSNNVALPAETGSAYTFTNVPFNANGAKFKVNISNAVGNTNSADATLTVLADTNKPTLVSVTGNEMMTTVFVVFSEPTTSASAGTAGNYGLDGGLTISPTIEIISPTKVKLTTSAQAPGTTYTLTVNNVRDTATIPNIIAAGSTKSFTAFVSVTGGLTIQTWLGIAGAPVQGLLDDPRYQANAPDEVGYVTAFNTRGFYPDDSHETYGGRLWGWIVPTESTNYTFFTGSDDACQLWLSTDATLANAVMIAERTAAGNTFLEPPNAGTSDPVSLQAGQRYYVYALWKENTGGDICRVAWRKDGDPTAANLLSPIPGNVLQTLAPPNSLVPPQVTITSPANGSILDSGAAVTLTATATTTSPKTIAKVEFYRSALKVGEVATPPYQLSVTGLVDNAYSFTAVARDSAGIFAESAPVNVSIGGPRQAVTLFAFAGVTLWSYNRDGVDLGTSWRDVGYNDAAWPTGLGPLGENTDNSEVIPIRTFVSRLDPAGIAYPTLYLRGHFNFPGTSTTGVKLSLSHEIDDGAVFYLNGVEVNRFGIAAGPVTYNTLAASHEAGPTLVGPVDLPIASLVPGDNVFAVEVHQTSIGSSDIVYGAELVATIPLVPKVTKLFAFADNSPLSYNRDGVDLGTTWKNVGYNDSAWFTGLGPLGENTDNSEVIPIRTLVSRLDPAGIAYPTLYVRGRFTFPGTNTAQAKLSLSHEIDDGAVFYLNGVEVNRFGIAAGPVTYTTLAASHEAGPALGGPVDISVASLVPGTNVWAAEVHQTSIGSSDIVYGAELTATTYDLPSARGGMTISRNGTNVTVSWTGTGTLQSATNVVGTYLDIPGATSPQTLQTTNQARFFRLKE